MTDWHEYPKEKPSEKDTYLVTFNFGDRELCTECTAYDPVEDMFDGFGNVDRVVAWTDYPKAYGEGGTEEWNVYPDNLPDEDTACFITCEDIRSGKRFVCENVFRKDFRAEHLSRYKVLAWMYIPKPYKSDTSHMKVFI